MLTKRIERCGYCRHEIKGQGLRHDSVLYCCRACRELGIDRESKKARGWGGWLAIFFIAGLVVTPRPAWTHDPYSSWTIPGQGKSCCNLTDCAVTRAKFEKGAWWAFVNSKRMWVKVPDERIVNYKTDDSEAHLCYGETLGEVYCFRPPKLGM